MRKQYNRTAMQQLELANFLMGPCCRMSLTQYPLTMEFRAEICLHISIVHILELCPLTYSWHFSMNMGSPLQADVLVSV